MHCVLIITFRFQNDRLYVLCLYTFDIQKNSISFFNLTIRSNCLSKQKRKLLNNYVKVNIVIILLGTAADTSKNIVTFMFLTDTFVKCILVVTSGPSGIRLTWQD